MGFISAVLVCWFTDCSKNKMYEKPNDDLAGRISNCFTNFQMFITVKFSLTLDFSIKQDFVSFNLTRIKEVKYG